MAINPNTRYPGQTVAPSGPYPGGSAQNVTVPGDGTGTPLEADWVNDLWGFLQALLDRAGISASGTPDGVGASDYLDSLSQWIGTTSDLTLSGYQISALSNFFARQRDVSGTVPDLSAVEVRDDGTVFFTLDQTNDVINQWNMTTTPFDPSVAVLSGNSLDVTAQEGTPNGMYLRQDTGTSLYVIGNSTDTIYRYNLPTPFSLAGSNYSGDSYTYSAQVTDSGCVAFAADGSKFFIGDNFNEAVQQYSCAVPWVLAGASHDLTFDLSGVSSGILGPRGLRWNADGSKLIVCISGSGAIVYEFDVRTAFDLTGASTTPARQVDLTGALPGGNLDGLAFCDSGMKMLAGTTGQDVLIFNSGFLTRA